MKTISCLILGLLIIGGCALRAPCPPEDFYMAVPGGTMTIPKGELDSPEAKEHSRKVKEWTEKMKKPHQGD